jgi:chemotaxis protein MotB
MKGMEPEKPPNHERWIISYADFTTLLLATFVVMYAVSTVNSSKFQEMAESFSTAFMGRTLNVTDTGFGAANKGPFNFMPNPIEVPVVTREVMIRNAPPALTEEETQGIPNRDQHGQFMPRGGSESDLQSQQQSGSQASPQSQKAAAGSMQEQLAQRVQRLDAAFQQLSKSLASLIQRGEVNVTLRPLGVVIDINEVLLFHSGKADLTPEALPLIDQIAKILADLRYQIQVNGFTDNVPIHNAQFDSNWDLSATRAISVVKRFVAAGIDPTLLVGAGFGEYHPVAPNNTVEGKASNRRVSIVVVSPLEGNDPARSRLLGSGADQPVSVASPAPAAPSPQATAPQPTTPASASPAVAPQPATSTPATPAITPQSAPPASATPSTPQATPAATAPAIPVPAAPVAAPQAETPITLPAAATPAPAAPSAVTTPDPVALPAAPPPAAASSAAAAPTPSAAVPAR